MDPRHFNQRISKLNRFVLTRREKQFIELVGAYFREKRQLNEEQEAILEGLYNEKLRLAKLGLIRKKATWRILTGNSVGEFRQTRHLEQDKQLTEWDPGCEVF
jgi:uncharacterized membrane-anchored protein